MLDLYTFTNHIDALKVFLYVGVTFQGRVVQLVRLEMCVLAPSDTDSYLAAF